MKYAIFIPSGRFLSFDHTSTFTDIGTAPLFDTQHEALDALQGNVMERGGRYSSKLRLVRVDEVVHAGETEEVRRKFSDAPANGTIRTRYEVDKHCPDIPTSYRVRCETVDGVLNEITGANRRCPNCGTFTVEAIDTVQLPPYTTRVTSELK